MRHMRLTVMWAIIQQFLTCDQSRGTNQTMFFRPRWLVPTIELIKYYFVLHHQHGRRASQEWLIIQR